MSRDVARKLAGHVLVGVLPHHAAPRQHVIAAGTTCSIVIADELELVCNDYRASGTGGYDVLAGCRVVRQYSDEDVPGKLARYIAAHAPVSITRNGGATFVW